MKWSKDLNDYFENISELAGIKYTMQERFLSHRCLSGYDVAIDTDRLFKVYQVFYFAYLEKSRKRDYVEVIVQASKDLHVSIESSRRIRDIRCKIADEKLTDDGKARKQRIVEKLFIQEKKKKLQLSFYVAAFPMLKSYICLFQGKDTRTQVLLGQQIQLFTNFLGCFVKPEHICGQSARQLKALDLNTNDDEKCTNQKSKFVREASKK